jgi:flagellar motor switch protein FliN/FliY
MNAPQPPNAPNVSAPPASPVLAAPEVSAPQTPAPPSTGAMHLLRDVEVEITLEIGRRRMRIADVLKITAGQTLELGKGAGEPLDLYVNGRLLGRGEAVVVGNRYGVRITELVDVNAEPTS